MCESVDGGGKGNDYFRGFGVEVDRALGEVPDAEIALDAAAPGANEREIEDATDYRTG